jgi:hypothetical protein
MPSAVWVVDLVNDRLFLNGQRFKTTIQPVRAYHNREIAKDEFLAKKPIWKNAWGWFVVQLDIGFDGRLFWKFFTRHDFKKLGGKPYLVLSYWHDRVEKKLKWFESDLSVPLYSVDFTYQKNLKECECL